MIRTGVVVSALFTLSGCAENFALLSVTGHVEFEPNTCGFGSKKRAVGVADVLTSRRYMVNAEVKNGLLARGTTTLTSGLDTSGITIYGFEIKYETQGLQAPLPTETTFVPAGGFVPGNNATLTIPFEAIPLRLMDLIAADPGTQGQNQVMVLISLRAVSRTAADQVLKSGTYVHPVVMCRGCLREVRCGLNCPAPTSASPPTCPDVQDKAIPCATYDQLTSPPGTCNL